MHLCWPLQSEISHCLLLMHSHFIRSISAILLFAQRPLSAEQATKKIIFFWLFDFLFLFTFFYLFHYIYFHLYYLLFSFFRCVWAIVQCTQEFHSSLATTIFATRSHTHTFIYCAENHFYDGSYLIQLFYYGRMCSCKIVNFTIIARLLWCSVLD